MCQLSVSVMPDFTPPMLEPSPGERKYGPRAAAAASGLCPATPPPSPALPSPLAQGAASLAFFSVPSPPHVPPVPVGFCLASGQSAVCVLGLYCVLPWGGASWRLPPPVPAVTGDGVQC